MKIYQVRNFLSDWLKIFAAFGYSLDGIRVALKTERALQQEVVLGVPMILYAALSAHTAVEKILLIGPVLLVWMAELFNTAIEATIARISHEIHPMAKIAKDTASAAVLMMLLLTGLSWGLILYSH
ncbi:MAG TPA: diacylglycerol kinase [Alphaproteobacteria bacterium]